jgi:cytosine/adenosine deaminase-related metal-dependent hydrolase
MPTVYAAWILPITGPPIRHGWVTTAGGRVVAVGNALERPPVVAGRDVSIDLGEVAVLPALVNAHTHLELSWLRGRVAPARGFIPWVTAMMRVRLQSSDGRDRTVVRDAMVAALAEMKVSGTGLVGDISNSLDHLDLLASSGLAGVVFHELIKFRATDPAGFVREAGQRIGSVQVGTGWRVELAPHAPYSVSPAVFAALRDTRAASHAKRMSVHVSESPDEVEFIQRGSGGWPDLLKRMGAWDPEWRAPRCSPVEYLDRLRFWDGRTLAVHAAQASAEDVALLASRGTTLVTCPRSNRWVGAGDPPVAVFYGSGARVAVGTDSLASVGDLNLFSELAALHRLAPDVEPARLLRSATFDGAAALGFDGVFGAIEPGKGDALLAVSVPPGTTNVEQYLVSGIAPDQVRWLDQDVPC